MRPFMQTAVHAYAGYIRVYEACIPA